MKVNNIRLLSVLLISFSLIYNGCSLYGLGIGAMVDSGKPDIKVIKPNDYKSINIGEEITIIIITHYDRSTKVGKFKRIDEEYLILETNFELESVNREEIFRIEVKSKKHDKWDGLLIGLILDVALFAFLFYTVPRG